jgi:hypothetical protein
MLGTWSLSGNHQHLRRDRIGPLVPRCVRVLGVSQRHTKRGTLALDGENQLRTRQCVESCAQGYAKPLKTRVRYC